LVPTFTALLLTDRACQIDYVIAFLIKIKMILTKQLIQMKVVRIAKKELKTLNKLLLHLTGYGRLIDMRKCVMVEYVGKRPHFALYLWRSRVPQVCYIYITENDL
jgi:hypothetical protein